MSTSQPAPPPEIPATPQTPEPKLNAMALLVASLGGAFLVLWGYEMAVCKGFWAALISALMRASFLIFVHLPTLAACVGLFLVFFGLTYALARRAPFSTRQELLPLVMPIVGLLVGVGVGKFAHLGVQCALYPWA